MSKSIIGKEWNNMPKNHDIIAIKGKVIQETEKAYLFTDGSMLKTACGKPSTVPKAQWLPKSQCEWDDHDKEMQLPEWLAIEKGLV